MAGNINAAHRLTPPDISVGGLAKLASPIFVANLAVMGNATIDTIMAGRLGAEDLAAVALASASTGCIFMLLVGIVQGLSPICGHHFGARKFEQIGFEINQSLYLIASAVAVPAALLNRVFISVNAAINQPRITMWISLLMLALKAPVNALFMYGLFGLPELGGAGAGVGNAVLAWFGLIFYAGYFFKGAHYKPMHAKRWFGPSFDALKEQLRIGLPIGLSVFFEVSSFTLMAIFISRMGAVAVSAHQIVSNITSTLYMVPLSIGIAASVLVSQCLGAGFPDAAERITRRSLAVTVAISATACCLLFIFSHFIISIYTTDIAVMQIAGTLILCGVIYHTFDAAQSVSSFILRGYKIAWVPMIVSGVALWGVGLFGGYNLAFRESFLGAPLGPLGFWIACACGLILSGITLVSFALYHARSVKLATQKA